MIKIIRGRFASIAGACLVLFAHQASAQIPMQFSFHDPCGGGNADYCAPVMVGRGVFDETTLPNFRAALGQYRKDLKISGNVAGISALIFDSPGGSLGAGVALGRELRRLKINTRAVNEFDEWVRSRSSGDYVEKPVLRNAKCLSACAYAFLGGSKRVVEHDKSLGVHQFRSAIGGQFSESTTQSTTAQLALYVESMGISSRFMTVASLTKPDEITYISASASRELKVDNVTIGLAAWTLSATDEGLPLLVVVQPLSESHRVVIRIGLRGETLYVGTNTLINLKETTLERVAQFPEDSSPAIVFTIDGRDYRGTPSRGWSRALAKDEVSFTALSVFPKSLLRALQDAQSIEISDDFGRATADISLSTKLSITGLRSGVALISRTR